MVLTRPYTVLFRYLEAQILYRMKRVFKHRLNLVPSIILLNLKNLLPIGIV